MGAHLLVLGLWAHMWINHCVWHGQCDARPSTPMAKHEIRFHFFKVVEQHLLILLPCIQFAELSIDSSYSEMKFTFLPSLCCWQPVLPLVVILIFLYTTTTTTKVLIIVMLHHIMANHGDIQPALSTCLCQLCVVELMVQYLWERATMVVVLTRRCQRWGAWKNAVGHLQG